MSIWRNLIKYYDSVEDVCPVAHTYITPSASVLIDQHGHFLSAIVNKYHDIAIVPCTWQSESRTSGSCPHLMSDNLSYLAPVPGCESRHDDYMKQLKEYVGKVPDDVVASAVYQYMNGGTLLDDIGDLIESDFNNQRPQGIYIAFAVYGIKKEADDLWTEYYVNSLPKNGICMVTGQPDFIPSSYPSKILSSNDKARIFSKGSGVGYIASQKIIHSLQYMAYAKMRRVKAEVEEFRASLKQVGFSADEIKEIKKDLIKWKP